MEFKEARTDLPRNLFESVCAFLNRDGGTVLLGVRNDGSVAGVDPDAVERLSADIVNLSNNPQKLDPPFIISPLVITYADEIILVLQVPASSDIHRCVGVVYDRGHDGDFQVKDPMRIAGMVNLKRGFYGELRVYPHLRLVDFEPGALVRARRLIAIRQPEHPWLPCSDEDFLVKAGFWRRDTLTATEGYTLAAGLVFGKEEVIQQMVPHYKIDALVRRENLDRYDDRMDIRTNLLDAYEKLMQFVAKHLPDPFYLEGDQRVSLREKIFREVVSNVLVHREYTDAHPTTFVIYRDRVEVRNAARAHGGGPIMPERFTPHPKNPTLSKFFVQMGRAEELGSGVLNVSRYLPFYAKAARPQFIEGNPFITIIPLPATQAGSKVESEVESKVESLSARLLRCLDAGPLGKAEIAKAVGRSRVDGQVHAEVSRMLTDGFVERTIPDKPNSRLQKYRLTHRGRSALG